MSIEYNTVSGTGGTNNGIETIAKSYYERGVADTAEKIAA